MVQAILNVFAIIALVLVGGFIIYALAELILSADGKRGTLFFRNRKNTDRDNEILLEYNKNVDTNDSFYVQNQNSKDFMLDFDKQYEQENKSENISNVNMLKADEERKLIEAKKLAEQKEAQEEQKEENTQAEVFEDFVYINKENPESLKADNEERVENTVEKVEEVVVDDEEDDDDQTIEEILNSIQERNKNARNRFLASLDDDDEEEFDEEEDFKLASEINQKVVTPAVEETEEVETVEEDEKVKANEEINKLNSIIEELNAKIEEQRVQSEELAERTRVIEEEKELLKKALEENQASEVTEEVTEETLNLYNVKLSELLERQKQNDKDLRINKKEYLPLLRIEKTLESDKTKLRRKEAIVAKKKMVLFGVNNYVADPEKEKKLLEDQDLLEGLKLSVAHCEEVMANNKDRYPVLKHTYEILTRNATELQEDIDELKNKIEHAKEVLSKKDSDGTVSE